MKSGLKIGVSKIDRQGVFATRRFDPGEKICDMVGRRVSVDDLERAYTQGNDRITVDALQISEHTYVLLSALCNSINHSCVPNAALRDVRTLIALTVIMPGEEITYDYSAVEWTPSEYTQYNRQQWPMRCKCGEDRCRDLVACFPNLPRRIQQRYLLRGIIQNHIKRRYKKSQGISRCIQCYKALILRRKVAMRRPSRK